VIVLDNDGSVATRTIANDLTAIVFGVPYTLPQERRAITLDPGTLAKYVGQYQFPPDAVPANAVHTMTLENGRLMRTVNGGPKIELLAESDTTFFQKGYEPRVTFILDADGRATAMTVGLAGREVRARKVK
jgi:hypothetical protein